MNNIECHNKLWIDNFIVTFFKVWLSNVRQRWLTAQQVNILADYQAILYNPVMDRSANDVENEISTTLRTVFSERVEETLG